MGMRRHLGGVLVAGGLFAACAGSSWGQSSPASPAPCMVAPQPVPCGATAAQADRPGTTTGKPAAERFPFPGEESGSGSSAGSPAANAPQAPDAAGSDAAKKQAGKDFPFPGEGAKPDAAGGSSSSRGSSSSSSGDDAAADPDASPDAAGLKDKGSEGSQAPQGRRLLHRVNPPGTKLQSPDEREAEDLDVAHFYTQSGDFQGAYMRSQDAVKTMPDDPDAHFALAEIARRLNKADEAIAEYNACLKLDPDPKEAKAARKELARLKP